MFLVSDYEIIDLHETEGSRGSGFRRRMKNADDLVCITLSNNSLGSG
jgi:hypothetical protein